MKIYLIRHGETDLNKKKMLQGQSDIELNDYGRELARITGEGLKEVPFDTVFTSPLKRAEETARLVIGSRNIPVIKEPRIQEISFGEFEGLCYGKENYNIPDKTFMNFFEAPAEYNVPPRGESFAAVMARTGEFLQELMNNSEYAGKTILLSTHGCALKAILAGINHTPVEQFWGQGVHKNCAVTILEVIDAKAKIIEEGKLYY